MPNLKLFTLLLALFTGFSGANSRLSGPLPYASPPSSLSYAPAPSPAALPRLPSSPATGGIKGAYWPSWQALTLAPSSIPTAYFTHVFYAFLQIDSTSYNLLVTQPDEQWMGNFASTLHAASPPAKAILSIGGYGADISSHYSSMVSSYDNRAAFIQSAISTARKYGFDGLDLDWEFPANPQDMSTLASLYQELRASIDSESVSSGKPKLLLSSAVYFAASFILPGAVTSNYPGSKTNILIYFPKI